MGSGLGPGVTAVHFQLEEPLSPLPWAAPGQSSVLGSLGSGDATPGTLPPLKPACVSDASQPCPVRTVTMLLSPLSPLPLGQPILTPSP